MDFINVIPNIVSGLEIEKGSLVLLNFWGENSDLAILDNFALEIGKVGGVPIRWQHSREFIKTYFTEVSPESLAFPDKYFEIFNLADAAIDIFMYNPVPHKDFSKDKLPFYSAYMRKLFSSITNGKKLFAQVRVPTVENAQAEGIEYKVYEESMLNALSVDLKKLKNKCEKLVNKLSIKNTITIHSQNNNILTFNLDNRKWHKDDGTGDIPCGEIYIAPVEKSANGKILIPEIILEGEKLSNVLLEFKEGKLIKCSSDNLLEFIKHFPGDNDIIAEFGIGLNENVKKLLGCTLIDEKCIGTAHIAIGMNDMFGGQNSSPLHLDFIFEPIRIEADGEPIMDRSKILL